MCIPVNQQSSGKQNGETLGNSYTEELYLLGYDAVYSGVEFQNSSYPLL
jgi:hypothetical protein